MRTVQLTTLVLATTLAAAALVGVAEDVARQLSNPVADEWNIVSRTILPVLQRENILPGAGRHSGIGDAVQRLFLSPEAPSAGGVALLQQGPQTVGAHPIHIWSFAGTERPPRSPRTSLP